MIRVPFYINFGTYIASYKKKYETKLSLNQGGVIRIGLILWELVGVIFTSWNGFIFTFEKKKGKKED